jgi:hypothetical protein
VSVEVRFPRVLAPIVGDGLGGEIEVGDTGSLRQALEDRWPGVATHLFDTTGVLRPHVLCFIDDASDRLEGEPREISDGSTIRIVQAVSGG